MMNDLIDSLIKLAKQYQDTANVCWNDGCYESSQYYQGRADAIYEAIELIKGSKQ